MSTHRKNIVVLLLVACGALCSWAQDLDGLFGDGDDDVAAFLELEDKPRMTQDAWQEALDGALRQTPGKEREETLLTLLDALVEQDDIIPLPRDKGHFVNALLHDVSAGILHKRVAGLLNAPGDLQFDLNAREKIDLGVRLSVVAGGASFEKLKTLYDGHAERIDLEWLLPALGRAGGADALSLVNSRRIDRSIIPLGHPQNIRRIPCAAMLGAAYAGDDEAFEKILAWYEEDFINRPRFAFYVAWAIQERMKPDYTMVEYCEHRLLQAERLLNVRGERGVPDLVARANRTLSVALVDYLTRKLATASMDDLSAYVPLLAHPSEMVKQRVLTVLLARGTDEVRRQSMAAVRGLLESPLGLDRFFAVKALLEHDPESGREALAKAVEMEPNSAVRRRLKMLAR